MHGRPVWRHLIHLHKGQWAAVLHSTQHSVPSMVLCEACTLCLHCFVADACIPHFHCCRRTTSCEWELLFFATGSGQFAGRHQLLGAAQMAPSQQVFCVRKGDRLALGSTAWQLTRAPVVSAAGRGRQLRGWVWMRSVRAPTPRWITSLSWRTRWAGWRPRGLMPTGPALLVLLKAQSAEAGSH